MKNRLKDLKLESVDLCYKGCNPEAKINLFKSLDGEDGERGLSLDDFTPEEIKQLKELLAEAEPERPADSEGGLLHKLKMLLGKGNCEDCKTKKQLEPEKKKEPEIQKTEQEEDDLLDQDNLEKMVSAKFDSLVEEMAKSKEAKLDSLLEKMIGEKVQASVAKLEKAQQESELAEMLNVAKQFTGDKPEELAENLMKMKAADESLYQAHLELLQQNKTLVKASKAFEELGKTGGYSSGSVNKIEAVAAELRKQDPSLNHWQARAKAWELNPEIKKEYEEELI